jgi:TPR repeat protein
MRELLAFVFVLGWAAGCEPPAATVAPSSDALAAPKPPVAEPQPQAQAEQPAAQPSAPEPAAGGECATSESCSAAAAEAERQGHAERAAALYTRACDLGLGQACHRLGELYRDGKGVAPDDDRARALFDQGCRQGSNASCDALGH